MQTTRMLITAAMSVAALGIASTGIVTTTVAVPSAVPAALSPVASPPTPSALFTVAGQDGPQSDVRRVEVRPDRLAVGRAASVVLDLEPGVSPVAALQPASPVAGGFDHWTGTLQDVPESMVTVIRRDAAVSALVSSPAGTYTITTTESGEQVLTKVSATKSDTDLVLTPPQQPDQPDHSDQPGQSHQPARSAQPDVGTSADTSQSHQPARSAQPDVGTSADTTPQIDVLVAYTPAAATQAGGVAAVQTLAAMSIAVSNDTFAASGVNLRLRLVGTVQSTGTGAGGADGATLAALMTPRDGKYDNVHAVRDATGADLVSMLVADAGQYCGVAYYPGAATYGFSVVAQSCAVGNLSFPHEIGHNLGAAHDRYASPKGYYPYGFGSVNVAGKWRTIMAYNDQCNSLGLYCNRIARWSNPTQSYNGSPLGVAEGQPDAADNRSALNATAATVAAYRQSVNATPPAITALSVSTASTLGGTPVTVTGENLTGATAVKVGTYAATSVKVISPTSLSFVAPAAPAGAAHVTVTTTYGTSAIGAADVLTYVKPPLPTVTGLSPTSGSSAAATPVVLTGTDLGKASKVTVGGASVPFTKVSETQLRMTLPKRAAGTFDVLVTTPAGTSPNTPTARFTYLDPPIPTITALKPAIGTTTASNTVTVTGNNLATVTKVTSGGVSVPFTRVSVNELAVTLPPRAAGVVTLILTNPAGVSSSTSATARFTYKTPPPPTVTSLSPASGTTVATTTVTVTGANLGTATKVTLGDAPVPFTRVSDTALTVTLPPHAAGVVRLQVTGPGGASSGSAVAARFTYIAPSR
jgi:hypothetical protein